ncbi:MAG: FAD-dependent oxidoreductase, partial [Marinirhabdus sp.]|nr:FAD-dependent oxidoreductase [Marinirhabdus sp.]
GGYCGLSQVETGAVNACYLTTYKAFKSSSSIKNFQTEVVSKNPHLSHFFRHATPLFEKPLTISQVSFYPKEPVVDHILMVGDSAGLIHPLCGNGMAMAIHSAKILSELLLASISNKSARVDIEKAYLQSWKNQFSKPLRMGRYIQNILLQPRLAKSAYALANQFPSMVPKIIKQTHGEVLL